MNENKLNELLEQCESPIECELLIQLYPCLTASQARELCAQYMIDRYDDIPVTIPDFALLPYISKRFSFQKYTRSMKKISSMRPSATLTIKKGSIAQ